MLYAKFTNAKLFFRAEEMRFSTAHTTYVYLCVHTQNYNPNIRIKYVNFCQHFQQSYKFGPIQFSIFSAFSVYTLLSFFGKHH